MNIPEIYLIEPYNPYAPKGRKKHWHEVVEEQALMARILAEQQAQQQALLEAKSRTTPPQAPPESVPTVVGNSAGAGQAGEAGSAPGGGGVPVFDFFNQGGQVISLTATSASTFAPMAVQFTDTSTGPQEFDTFFWNFGDGTTSTAQNPIHTYDTGSFTATFQLTASTGYVTSTTQAITASTPSVTAAFTLTGATVTLTGSSYTASVNDPLTFVNGSTTTGGPLTYLWTFGSASLTSVATNPPFVYTNANTYTVKLAATGSYSIANAGSRTIKIV